MSNKDQKDKTVLIRLSELDKRLLQERSEAEQLTMSSYIRHKLLKKEVSNG
jgi:hypothetical protein